MSCISCSSFVGFLMAWPGHLSMFYVESFTFVDWFIVNHSYYRVSTTLHIYSGGSTDSIFYTHAKATNARNQNSYVLRVECFSQVKMYI
ncbi:hypothetical protein FN846DRAFT_954631 [Sphaerosporella brunnea]|uniref:Uncharacterized protein n=1 Tax=Sphaerosporella brunnea TaxID=1250544 RepID=A0A5J5ETW9_9PEZI|nr:hypothetical protein FN846DRAFT_954631 [Sphaerosporella brunnea]